VRLAKWEHAHREALSSKNVREQDSHIGLERFLVGMRLASSSSPSLVVAEAEIVAGGDVVRSTAALAAEKCAVESKPASSDSLVAAEVTEVAEKMRET
jgi:hypothetical protein